MNRQVIHNEFLGDLQRDEDTDSWQAEWRFSRDHTVNVIIRCDDELCRLPENVYQVFLKIKSGDDKIRLKLAQKLIRLCNEDWNPSNQITEEEFAKRISLEGIIVSLNNESAEVFYTDADIFAGHAISFFMNFNGEISEPNLAG
jgi:hypothetical protein